MAEDTSFVLTPQGENSTRVLWNMTGKKSLMLEVMGFFSSVAKMIGPDFEKGPDRLE